MDSSPTQTLNLKILLEDIIKWIQEERVKIPCLSMASVSGEKQEAFVKVNGSSFLGTILFLRDHVIPRLEASHLSSFICRRFRQNHVWSGILKNQNFKQEAEMLDSFFKELFQLPNLQHEDLDDTLIKYHLPGDFLKFLGEFLKYETLLVSSFGLDNVLEELNYLIPIFQDRPFQVLKHEVQCLWEHFEGLINETGRFVYSFFFSPNLMDRKFCEVLTSSIELLKCNIVEFFRTLPHLSTSSMVVYHDVDSFFIIPSLLNDLKDFVNRCFGPIFEIRDQIGGLRQGLMLSWSLLKEHIELNEFKEIAVQIRDMAYGAENMINSCLAGETQVWYVKLSLASVIHGIELIQYQLLEMKESSDDWALRSVSNTSDDGLSTRDRRSVTDQNEIIVGFQEEEQSILEQLLGGTRNLLKVGIVGTPGLGKTTLAKKLHNHHAVFERFDKRSWCVISQRYQWKDLLVDILKDLGEEAKPDMDEEVKPDKDEANLALQIYQTLKGRRYLITLDDIWNLDAWDEVQSCFPDDDNGSRILFTSRNKDAAPSGSIINSLPFLSNDQCWELIRKLVFQGKTCPLMLMEIGKEISAKCKGLPLVVTVIAGTLSTIDKKFEAWENVKQDLELRNLLDQNEQVIQMLELSYKHLLQHLKPCFLYFALFHEDKKIFVKNLNQLWVAEGFIEEDEEKKKSVESISYEYLMELINKSLVMVVERGSDGNVKTCKMHDLLHSMGIKIAEEENFLKRIDSYSSLEYLKFNRLLFLYPTSYEEHMQLGSRFRSIFFDPPLSYKGRLSSVYKGRLSSVYKRSVRVLDDQSNWNHQVNGVGRNLVGLRYLAVGGHWRKSIGSFLKLEYLILPNSFVDIPSDILKMPKLRYLKAWRVVVDDNCEISQLPDNLEYVSVLQIPNFKFIQMFKSTSHIRRLKFKLHDDDSFSLDLDLSFLTQLESLSLSVSMPWVSTTKFEHIGINFPCSIRKLSIVGLGYPWRNMSMIGALPNLQVLKLEDGACWGDTWNTSDSGFKKLRFLKLQALNLCRWNISSGECFPCLQQIVLNGLYALGKIPKEIVEIETLQLIKVLRCLRSVEESAKEIEQEQRDFGNEDLRVTIDDYSW